jgi:hypothetical protein
VSTTSDPDFVGASVTFNADGTFVGTQADGTETTGTYTQSGSTITVNSEGYSAQGAISGNSISFDYTYPDGTTETATIVRA